MKVKKLVSDAIIPTYGTKGAAGADLYSIESVTIDPGQTVFVHTGIAVAIPEGCAGLVMARSGLSCKQGLAPANKVGLIDMDYRGEIMVALHNHSNESRWIDKGERIAQFMIVPYLKVTYDEVESLDDTFRGNQGFGSTGK